MSFFIDAHREEYVPQHAGTSTRVDILVPSADVLVEVKNERNASHVKTIADEIKIDNESYYSPPIPQNYIGHYICPQITYCRP